MRNHCSDLEITSIKEWRSAANQARVERRRKNKQFFVIHAIHAIGATIRCDCCMVLGHIVIMSIITTFENQCRALTSASSPDENASRFIVGTHSPHDDNLIHLFEYKDDNNNLAKVSFKFPFGEAWHLSTSSKYSNFVTGVVGQNGRLKISLFKLPHELENSIEDDYCLSESAIEEVFNLVSEDKNLTRQCHWHPDDGNQLLTCNNSLLEFWDINKEHKLRDFSMYTALDQADRLESYQNHLNVTDLRWSSLFNCSVVAATIDSKIYGIDTRIADTSPSSICWLIDDKRCNRIKSIDFNPNSQYYLASGGDDCRANFWDLRRTSDPCVHLQTHTHWIWTIRYNPYHDQLVLSAGSDARVALMRVQSIASEPFGQLADYEDDENFSLRDVKDLEDDSDMQEPDHNDLTNTDIDKSKLPKQLGDEVLNVYEEHDDSVYAAEWLTDPWIFASLGYESRLVINKVPKAEKFNILF